MKREYYETVNVKQVNLWKSAILTKPVEGNVSLIVEDRSKNRKVTLECFVYEELEAWGKVKAEESVLVRLVLLNWRYNATRPKLVREKSMRHLKGYEYNLAGEVIKVATHPNYDDSLLVILDCGIYVETRVGKNLELKVGDYIKAEGRLDAHIMGEEK